MGSFNEGRKPVQLVIAGALGVLLAGSAFNAAFAGGGSSAAYGGGGLDGGEIAGILAGSAVVMYGASTLIGGAAADDDCGEEFEESKPAKAASGGAVKARLVPSSANPLSAGSAVSYQLQLRSGSGAWKDVTRSSATRLTASGGLIPVDGAKNAFILPLTETTGRSIQVQGTFAPAGKTPVTVSANVAVAAAN